MTTPWPTAMQQDLMHVTQAELARTSRQATQLRELRLAGGRRRLPTLLTALFRRRRAVPRATGPRLDLSGSRRPS
jgi:hypothetical protein